MAAKILKKFFYQGKLYERISYRDEPKRSIVSKQSGAFCPKPQQVPLGLIRVIITVIPGLLIGACISKTMANFLEENDLFVPSDDDDDDDD